LRNRISSVSAQISIVLIMEYEIKPAKNFSLNLKELWEYGELFYFFTWRDIKVKYKQTVLGFAWAILQPTLMMLVFTFLFGKAIGAQSHVALPYPVFVYTGLMLWGIFSGGLQTAGNSMISNANIIKKIYFPRLIIPMSSILVSLFDFLMTLIPFAGLLLYYQVEINWLRMLLFLPLSILIMLMVTFGIGCFIAALNVKYRDFRYVLPFLIQFLMFASPVIYPVTLVENKWISFLLQINPLSSAINLFRAVFDNGAVDYTSVAVGVAIAFVSLIIGVLYFRKTEAYFADLA
jgi:lipopolysaccharide transport system permease protein